MRVLAFTILFFFCIESTNSQNSGEVESYLQVIYKIQGDGEFVIKSAHYNKIKIYIAETYFHIKNAIDSKYRILDYKIDSNGKGYYICRDLDDIRCLIEITTDRIGVCIRIIYRQSAYSFYFKK